MSEILMPFFDQTGVDPSLLMVGEGRFIVERMLLSGVSMKAILCEEKHCNFWTEKAEGKCPVTGVDSEELTRMAGYDFHRGVLAAALKPGMPALSVKTLEGWHNVLILPSLGDPDNLGAILRAASCFDVDAVLLGEGCPDPFSRRVLRKSMGHCLFVPLLAWDKTSPIADYLTNLDFALLAADCSSESLPLTKIVSTAKKALVMGHESDGLPSWCSRAQKVIIPMKPGSDSLNVAMAAGILMNHFFSPANRS